MTHDPHDSQVLNPCVLGLHFTTARPLEVRLRLPLGVVVPGHPDARGTYAAWVFDRLYLKASCWVVDSKFGIGDVQAGISDRGHWLCQLRRGPLRVVVGTHPAYLQGFSEHVDRISPDPEAEVDIDAAIEQLLGASS
jgi:hypothetical protein